MLLVGLMEDFEESNVTCNVSTDSNYFDNLCCRWAVKADLINMEI